MIAFLNPTFLYGLAAISLPLWIHFLSRRKPKKIDFSSLRFLQALQKRRLRRLKIRQILLLILRALIILFIVLAFARPTLKGSLPVVGFRAKTAAVIILDNSFSMEADQLFQKAKHLAQQILDLFVIGDEVSLISSDKTFQGPTYNAEKLKDSIQKQRLSFQPAHLHTALQLADETLLKSRYFNKEIYLISDFQNINFDEKNYRIKSRARIFLLPLEHERIENIGIEKVKVANQILQRGKPVQIEATVKNYGKKPAKAVLIQLYVEGKRCGQASVDLKGGGERRVVFRVVPEQSGQISGWVEIEEDALPTDNRRYFTFFIPPVIKTLLVGNRRQDIRYLHLALKPTRDSYSSLVLRQVLFQQLDTLQFHLYDVIFFSNVPFFNDEQVQKLRSFLTAGGGVALLPGSDVDLKAYNEHLLKELDLPLLTGTSGKIGNREAFLVFGSIDYSHPLFRGVFEKRQKRINSPEFYFILKLQKSDKATSIIDYDNGVPFLEELRVGRGRLLLFTCGVDLKWSNLVHKSIFAPLINRCAHYLARGMGDRYGENLVGTELTFTSLQQGREYLLEKPDGKRVKVLPEIRGNAIILTYNDTDLPGVYRLFIDGKLSRGWPVNVNPKESKLEKMTMREVKNLLGGEMVYSIESGDDLKKAVKEARFGRELWRQCVLIAGALLIVEMLLSKGKGSSQEGE